MTTITPEGPVPKRRRIALIAHDHKKDDMIAFAQTHKAFLMRCDLLATGTTGGRLQDEVGLSVQRMLSGRGAATCRSGRNWPRAASMPSSSCATR